MRKILLVIEREYLVRVRKKTFLLTTILVPIIIMGFYALMIRIGMEDSTEKRNIAIIDQAGLFNGRNEIINKEVYFKVLSEKNGFDTAKPIESTFYHKYSDLGYEAFVFIPQLNLQAPAKLTIHSKTNLDILTISAVENTIADAIMDKQLEQLGISKQVFQSIRPEIELENKVTNEKGSNTSVAEIGFFASFLCGIMIYMMMLIYGTQVMRGVMEEKTSRISEVVVSSVKPFQLMMGKIIGIGAVGLTQFLIWMILIFVLHGSIPMLAPAVMEQTSGVSGVNENMMLQQVMTGIEALPILKIILSFVGFFLGGYLTYSAMFAAIGSLVGDDQQDAQQFMFPVMMPIILGFVIMTKAAQDPNSSLAIFGSYFPLTSPIVMMGRITYDIPWWEIGLSFGLLVICFIFLAWISGRIYRTGILMYGKKPGWKELARWAFGRP